MLCSIGALWTPPSTSVCLGNRNCSQRFSCLFFSALPLCMLDPWKQEGASTCVEVLTVINQSRCHLHATQIITVFTTACVFVCVCACFCGCHDDGLFEFPLSGLSLTTSATVLNYRIFDPPLSESQSSCLMIIVSALSPDMISASRISVEYCTLLN